MCLDPITIPNPSKFVSLKHKDQAILQVPCGHCAECQQVMSNQYLYRAWHEFSDCLNNGGFILFDTLTYSDKFLPHLSDYMSVNQDFSCFSRVHVHKFLDNLQKRLTRKYQSKFRYFLSSEYGSGSHYVDFRGRLRRATNRPHYHVLFYVYGAIKPLEMSRLVSEIWKYGLTDGVPYKSAIYVHSHNIIDSTTSVGGRLRTVAYVTKYVQKSCFFDSELHWRINSVVRELAFSEYGDDADNWLATEDCRRLRLKLKRQVNLFHLQSQHFGESALADLDLNQVIRDGYLVMPSYHTIKAVIPLPTYYKRKLFYEQIKLDDGSRFWQLTDFGLQYKNARKPKLRQMIEDRFETVCMQFKLPFNASDLADYVLDKRGRIKGIMAESRMEDRLRQVDLYAYLTTSDKAIFGKRFYSYQYYGNSQVGYDLTGVNLDYILRSIPGIPIMSFVSRFVFFDDAKEKQLNKIAFCLSDLNSSKQKLFLLKQRLSNVYKQFI